MTGAESIVSSRMMAKRRLTFAPVTSSKRSAPAGEKVSRDVVLAEVLLVLADRCVGDVVARQLGAPVKVERPPADLLQLAAARSVDRLGDRSKPIAWSSGTLSVVAQVLNRARHSFMRLGRVLWRLARHARVEAP